MTDWWRERTLREQRLLLVMLALIALVLGWLLVIRPLSDALDEAQRRHGEAVLALAQAEGRAEAARRLRGERAATAPLPVEAFVAQTSREAGFANARIVGQGPARATMTVEAVRPQAFFAWVRQMEHRGLIVEALRARANNDRTLSVEAGFRAGGTR